MEKIKIITDSTADLPRSIIEKYQIEVLPLTINFGEKTYVDGIDIDFKSLLEKIEEGEGFPHTSQVIPQRFIECYKRYLDEGYKIISLHLSSKMSGTYQSACIAKETLDSEEIVVIDGQSVTSGLGLLVIKACILVEEGKNIFDIKEDTINTIPHVKSVLAFDCLEHLVKGGRLSKTAGVIGNILGIKPILTVKDGEMAVEDKVRGSKKALKYILEHLENVQLDEKVPMILLNAENEDIIEVLREKLIKEKYNFVEAEVGCTVGTHSGPRACGVFFIEKY
ncbi:DegV family protein [Clostridium amazonitimonense]|uniref:DegV family protein n=1 Tax=Clostridium amazonitimonense TaxID=1499689 RepID=UPI0005097733|nr:DegV family protein [Clostridium amazonitimonense]